MDIIKELKRRFRSCTGDVNNIAELRTIIDKMALPPFFEPAALIQITREEQRETTKEDKSEEPLYHSMLKLWRVGQIMFHTLQ
jgi:hypothetical protein